MSELHCKIKKCDRLAATVKHGLCFAHYMQWRRKGDVVPKPVRIYEKVPVFTERKTATK